MFLLVSCSFAFQYVLCFVHGQGQRTKEIKGEKKYYKKLASFITSLVLLTYCLMGRISNFKSIFF